MQKSVYKCYQLCYNNICDRDINKIKEIIVMDLLVFIALWLVVLCVVFLVAAYMLLKLQIRYEREKESQEIRNKEFMKKVENFRF